MLGGETFLCFPTNLRRVDLRLTRSLRGTCRLGPAALQPTPGAQLAQQHSSRPWSVQAARCLLALHRTPCLLHGRRHSGRPEPQAWKGSVGPARGARTRGRRCVGSSLPGWAALGRCSVLGQTSPPHPPSLFLAVSSDSCGARRPLPTERVTASVGKVCCGFALSCPGRGCAPRRPHPQGARSVGGAEPCSPEPQQRTRPPPPITY